MNILRVTASTDASMGGPPQGIMNSIAELGRFEIHNEVVCCDAPDAAWSGMHSFPVHAPGNGRYGLAFISKIGSDRAASRTVLQPLDQDFRLVAKAEAMRVTGGRRRKRGAGGEWTSRVERGRESGARGAGFGQRRAF